MPQATVKRLESSPRTSQICERIWQYIVDNGLPTGSALPSESEFADQLGVSRGAVREAVKQLAALDLVESRHGVGLRVGHMRASKVLARLLRWLTATEMGLLYGYKLRMLLEVGALATGFERITADQIAVLDEAVQGMKVAENNREFLAHDRRFHCTLAANAELREDLVALMNGYFDTRLGFDDLPYEGRWAELGQEHAAVVAALKRGDKSAALAALEWTFQKHIAGWEEFAQRRARNLPRHGRTVHESGSALTGDGVFSGSGS